MAGNVWEWCWDISAANRVGRGGSWSYGADDCRVAYPLNDYPGSADNDLGFRVCRRSS